MHRLLLTSGAYRQSSLHLDPAATRLDPQNRYLWRFRRHRLEGEAVRDSILTASGRLNGDRGGPPVFPPLPRGLDAAQKVQGTNTWETMPGPRGRKRSVYIFQRRSLSMPLMETFDAPVLNASCARRETSISVLQALTMYDGEFVNEEARHFADRVRREGGGRPCLPDPASLSDRPGPRPPARRDRTGAPTVGAEPLRRWADSPLPGAPEQQRVYLYRLEPRGGGMQTWVDRIGSDKGVEP